MPESTAQALEHVIEEQQFLAILQEECDEFCSLVGTLLAKADSIWHKKHFFQLLSRFETFETLLDDHGARHNRTFSFLRELTASIRGIAQAGYSLSHMSSRLSTYQVLESLDLGHYHEFEGNVSNVRTFIQDSILSLLGGLQQEMQALGVEPDRRHVEDSEFESPEVRQLLPHNLGEDELGDERARLGEVASKFLLATERFQGKRPRRIDDADRRHEYLLAHFSEVQTRVFEATVHNLQSAYDTHIKNSGLESSDPRLPQLRGLVSSALHMLEAATCLTHFCERHEGDIYGNDVERRLNDLVNRSDVEERTLHHLLMPAMKVMSSGNTLAKALLSSYTTTQELKLTLEPRITLHARPAALIVGVVTHHGTPVELEVRGARCNAGSILELLVCVGSHPEERDFTFLGDQAPLRDLALLFQHSLGENGLHELPEGLSYLTNKA